MFRESNEEDYGASSGEDRAAGLRPQPLRVFAEQHPSREAHILSGAADLIGRPGGWCQGTFQEGNSYCAVGAIAAANASTVFSENVIRAANILSRVLPGEAIVPHWNDAPERTQAEVVSKLREAAALAREQAA